MKQVHFHWSDHIDRQFREYLESKQKLDPKASFRSEMEIAILAHIKRSRRSRNRNAVPVRKARATLISDYIRHWALREPFHAIYVDQYQGSYERGTQLSPGGSAT